MMYNAVLIFHIFITVGVIGVILVQRGRSGGLIESLGGVESIFGTKTSSFFVKITVVLAILFFVTAISLAYLSKEKGKSLIDKYEKNMPKVETKEGDVKSLPEGEDQQHPLKSIDEDTTPASEEKAE